MFSARRASVLLAVFAILGLGAQAASAQQGSITGRVLDAETGAPLSGAAVAVVGQDGFQGTNASGTFQWSVPAGTYSVVVTLIGYETGRLDGVGVSAGESTTVEITLRSTAEVLNPIVVTASRRQEKALDAPASITAVSQAEIAKIAAPSVAEHVKALPGVDMAQTGLTQTNVVARGFNNVFSGALLTIQDNRYARVPSIRLNANNMIPTTDLDIERIEVSLGPGAALYGPNAASGVMHIITSSPIDRPGSSISLAGGERSVFHGQFRSAVAPSEQFGFKISGQYFRGDDWEFTDPQEAAAALADPTNPLIGARNFEAERYSAEARFDFPLRERRRADRERGDQYPRQQCGADGRGRRPGGQLAIPLRSDSVHQGPVLRPGLHQPERRGGLLPAPRRRPAGGSVP